MNIFFAASKISSVFIKSLFSFSSFPPNLNAVLLFDLNLEEENNPSFSEI
jgi:hypothetical protein